MHLVFRRLGPSWCLGDDAWANPNSSWSLVLPDLNLKPAACRGIRLHQEAAGTCRS